MEQLGAEGRAPKLVVLENVYGALRSHDGKDFTAIAGAIADAGYRFGALIMDAADFLPQSRPRLFIVCLSSEASPASGVFSANPNPIWHPPAVIESKMRLPEGIASNWIWWNPSKPPSRRVKLVDIIEENPEDASWNSEEATKQLLAMMTPTNLAKVRYASQEGRRMVGCIYKRTRQGRQRAEVRFDLAGCLRTPAGGSSRQTLLIVDKVQVRSRLLSAREAARLMGLPDSYQLPENYNQAYHLAGDGVAVPVVRYLAEQVLDMFARGNPSAECRLIIQKAIKWRT